MTVCEVCQNDYVDAFTVVMAGKAHVFDCFECAVHALAPTCEHCGCRILGHGVQAGEQMFCGASCARFEGIPAARDHV